MCVLHLYKCFIADYEEHDYEMVNFQPTVAMQRSAIVISFVVCHLPVCDASV